MRNEHHPPSEMSGDADIAVPEPDPSLAALRDILFRHYRERIDELEVELEDLDRRVTDKDALIATIPSVHLILAVNKCDLLALSPADNQPMVDLAQIEAVAASLGAPCYCTSAKTGDKVDALFRYMGRLLAR